MEAKPRLELFTCLSRGWEGPVALPLWTTPALSCTTSCPNSVSEFQLHCPFSSANVPGSFASPSLGICYSLHLKLSSLTLCLTNSQILGLKANVTLSGDQVQTLSSSKHLLLICNSCNNCDYKLQLALCICLASDFPDRL